jgi:hypothetical protein
MTVVELENENKLHETDIHNISELVAYAIDLKSSVESKKTVDSKESILDSLAGMLEMMLTTDIGLTREKKLNIIHLLSKLKANKEYMNLLKGSLLNQQRSVSKLRASSKHMLEKSQSAFGTDQTLTDRLTT